MQIGACLGCDILRSPTFLGPSSNFLKTPRQCRRTIQLLQTRVCKHQLCSCFTSKTFSDFRCRNCCIAEASLPAFSLRGMLYILSSLFHCPAWNASLYRTKLHPLQRRLGMCPSSISFQLSSSPRKSLSNKYGPFRGHWVNSSRGKGRYTSRSLLDFTRVSAT